MRTLFLLLLLANIAFFAWSHYVEPPESSADPQPLTRQIQPEKLKLISPDALPPLRAVSQPVAYACLEWGGFTLADAPRAEKALEPLALGARLVPRRTDEAAGWWVFIPSPGSRAAALKKAGELKALAVNDFFIVQDEGAYQFALSLGVFRTEEAANARLEALRSHGVRTARVGARDTVVPKVWLQVKEVDNGLYARLKDAARALEGSELRECSQ